MARRLLWFAGLWAASLAAMGVAVLAIHLLMPQAHPPNPPDRALAASHNPE